MFKSFALLAALALGSFAVANATPINGSLGITGGGDTWDATTIHFSGPGMVNAQTGTFASINFTGAAVFLNDFTYTPANYSPTSYILFSTIDGISLNVTEVTTGFVDVTGLHMAGYGFLTENGYDNTPGSFILNSSNSGDAVTFQATTTASPVPEPASLALFGTGLLGIVGIARRKFNI